MENSKINEFYSKQILETLSNYSFDSNIFDENFNISAVARTLDPMCYEISKRKPTDLNIKMATDVARRMNISEEIVTANNSKSNTRSFNDAIDEEKNQFKISRNYEKRLCLEVAFLLIYNFFYKDQHIPDMYESVDELMDRYNEFKNVDNEKELKLLLTFRNVMKIAQKVVPAKNNKTFLLDVVTRIAEGKDAKYITGSGQTAATARRVQIYEKEGGITAQARPPRRSGSSGMEGSENNDDIVMLPEKRKYGITAAYTSLSSSTSSSSSSSSATLPKLHDLNYSSLKRNNTATLDVLAALSAGLPSVSVNTEEVLGYVLDIDTNTSSTEAKQNSSTKSSKTHQ